VVVGDVCGWWWFVLEERVGHQAVHAALGEHGSW
jgi:hypothetical protein